MYRQFEKLLEKNETTSYRVSQDTGIPTATLSDWKRGLSVPKADKLYTLAKYFDVPIEYFLEEETR